MCGKLFMSDRKKHLPLDVMKKCEISVYLILQLNTFTSSCECSNYFFFYVKAHSVQLISDFPSCSVFMSLFMSLDLRIYIFCAFKLRYFSMISFYVLLHFIRLRIREMTHFTIKCIYLFMCDFHENVQIT